MKKYQKFFGSMLIAAISGLIILGILGRAVTVLIALFTNRSSNLSLSGMFEVMLLSAVIGSIGGILIYMFQKVFRANCWSCGIMNGLLLFLISSLYLFLSGNLSFHSSILQFFTFSAVALIFIIYGLIACKLIRRFITNRSNYS